ncbi:hypothetical protein KKC94_02685 [Patescibacteria group bacterium]|nr:hypothetical protein [Patescibacteria group bacterium]
MKKFLTVMFFFSLFVLHGCGFSFSVGEVEVGGEKVVEDFSVDYSMTEEKGG